MGSLNSLFAINAIFGVLGAGAMRIATAIHLHTGRKMRPNNILKMLHWNALLPNPCKAAVFQKSPQVRHSNVHATHLPIFIHDCNSREVSHQIAGLVMDLAQYVLSLDAHTLIYTQPHCYHTSYQGLPRFACPVEYCSILTFYFK